MSIYAGRSPGESVRTFNQDVTVLYAGTWKAYDNNIGIALASISDNFIPVDFNFNSAEYNLPLNGQVYITANEGKEMLNSYANGLINVKLSLKPKGLCIIEIVPSV